MLNTEDEMHDVYRSHESSSEQNKEEVKTLEVKDC